MPRILLTAFEPYETWKTNASWLALIELTRDLPKEVEITTRLYPVELEAMKDKLTTDLKANFDFAFHVGQAPRTSCIQLEELAVNVACSGHTIDHSEQAGVVSEGGADAYRCQLPSSQVCTGTARGRNSSSRLVPCRYLPMQCNLVLVLPASR